MNIGKSNLNLNGVSFSGHKKTTDTAGYDKHDFFYLYDVNKYKCEVEFYSIQKDKNGNLSIKEVNGKPAETVALEEDSRLGGGKVRVDLKKLYGIESTEGFAYRYKLTDKKDKKNVSYAFDNGNVIGIFSDLDKSDNKFNVVLNNTATINKNGPMQLIMPDEYYPGVVRGNDGRPTINEAMRSQALASVRTHANKLGGNFEGIIKRLPEISKEGIKRIVGTPFTRDTISSHLYWTENAYQVGPSLGTQEDFGQLQTELFKNGINRIADAALVNEGFGGIHLSELLRKGQDSVCKDMFREGEKISLHIIPENLGRTKMKIINPPFTITNEGKYIDGNSAYRADKPTYVQFYHDELASDRQKTSDSPIVLSTYDNRNTGNIYDITKHDDSVYPFPVEVNPKELARNVKRVIADSGKKGLDISNLDTATLKRITDFTNFNIETKAASASGLEVWDGNVDIAKLNFYTSDKDDARFAKLPEEEQQEAIADFNRGGLAVRDYAINSGKYWTKFAADTQFEYASTTLSKQNTAGLDAKSYMNMLKGLVDSGEMPKILLDKVNEETVQAVMDDYYHLRRLDEADMRAYPNSIEEGNEYTVSDYVLRQAMDLPLETLPVATNLLGILTSPYIAKRANIEGELGVSRFDLTKAGNPNLPDKYSKTYSKMDEIYEKQITPIIEEIAQENPEISKDGKVSEYGKYLISEIAPDLTKYILVKALNKKADIKIDDEGRFDFSNVNPEDITMQSLGIPYSGLTSYQEAEVAVNAIKNGIKNNITNEDKQELKLKLNKRLTSRSLLDYKMAEMIIDKTESGLGWRIDAAKDIASIDSVRSGVDSMTSAWDKVIDFWKHYNQAVLAENPHAYTTAEITDLSELFQLEKVKTKYTGDGDAERKFLEETGITSIANYNFLFSKLPDLFAPLYLEDFDDPNGWQANKAENHELVSKLTKGWGDIPGFLFQSADDGVVNSYTFVGNHDKPRMLHLLSLDQRLFHSDFKNDEHKKIAAEVMFPEHSPLQIKNDINNIDFDKVNSYAIAMGSRINQAIDDTINSKKLPKETKKQMKEYAPDIKKAVSMLAKGEYLGKNFDAEAFGTRPFEIAIRSVFEQADTIRATHIPQSVRDELEPAILQSILEPAYDRFFSIYKLLVALPGSPTDFAGDRVGASGYESKAKNYHQQNRNVIRWEWLNDDKYSFIANAYKQMNKISNLRNRAELSALNDGATITLPIENPSDGNKYKYQSFIRYNDKSVVLVVTDSTGANSPRNEMMDRTTTGKYGKTVKDSEGNDIKNGEIDFTPILNHIEGAGDRDSKNGLKHGITPGTQFKNAREDDKSVYTVKVGDNNKYYIERTLDGKTMPVVITPEDLNTLILYKV